MISNNQRLKIRVLQFEAADHKFLPESEHQLSPRITARPWFMG